MKTWHVIAFVVVGLIALAAYGLTPLVSPKATVVNRSSNNVILRAAPGNTMVQMFVSLAEGGEAGVLTFPDGFGCRKMSDRITYDEDGGPPMYFYKLNCNGSTGYVNELWVRAR